MQKTISIEGMSCPHCVMHAQKALAKIEGVIEATVDLATKSATVKTDKEIDDAVFKAAIEDAGYTVTKIC
jgi:copper chaperone CopZ